MTFVGRHEHHGRDYQGEMSGARYPWDNYGEKPTWLSLSEAAARSHTSVHELKQAIEAGQLRAEPRGWMRIHHGDLKNWLHAVP